MKIIVSVIVIISIIFIGYFNVKGTLKIKGRVIDEYTEEPIPGREIIVQGLVVKNNGLIPVETGNFSTDISGNFTYSLKKVKGANTYNFCLVGDSDYSFMAEKLALTYLKRNAKQLSFSLKKLANLTLLISRKSKLPVCDTLYLSWKSDGVDGRSLYPYKINNGLAQASQLRWIGGKVESIIKTRAFAEERTTVRWALFRNGKRKEIIDSIICKRDLANMIYLKY